MTERERKILEGTVEKTEEEERQSKQVDVFMLVLGVAAIVFLYIALVSA